MLPVGSKLPRHNSMQITVRHTDAERLIPVSKVAGKAAVDIELWAYNQTPLIVMVHGYFAAMTRLLPAPLIRCGY
jgi:hypothetical protein